VFTRYQDCLSYCVDTVFDRAEWLHTEPYDLAYGKLKDGTYPIMRREAVRKRLQREKSFTLCVRFDEDGDPVETVSVGWCEAEVA